MEFQFRAGDLSRPSAVYPFSSPPTWIPTPPPTLINPRLNHVRNAERGLMMAPTPPKLLFPPSDLLSDRAVRLVPLPRRLRPSTDPFPEVKRMRSAKGLDAPKAATKAWGCAVCGVSATSEEGLREHLRGKKHMKKAKALDPPRVWGCAVCDISATSQEALRDHLRGKQHLKKTRLGPKKKTRLGSSKKRQN